MRVFSRLAWTRGLHKSLAISGYLFCSLGSKNHQGRGVVNSSISSPDDLGHRDFMTREACDFAEFSKIALANLLDARSTSLFFLLVQFSAVLVFLCSRNLSLFFDKRKSFLMLPFKFLWKKCIKSHVKSSRSQNYVGKLSLSLSASEKVCLFQLYTAGELETWLRNSL